MKKTHVTKCLAPVLISVYHRQYTLRRCIDALLTNEEAAETDLFVVSDAASRAEDVDRISSIRKYVKHLRGFKSVTLIAREVNLGSNKSIRTAIDELLNKYGRIVFMEDDILPSKYYLGYMNNALDFYADNDKIFAVCGYKSNFAIPRSAKGEVFVLPRYSPWGVGLWANKRISGKCAELNRYDELKSAEPVLFKFLEENDPSFLSILKGDSEGKLKAGDVRVEYHLMRTGRCCLYPRTTMTNVMSSGDDALHCGMKWIPDEPLATHRIEDVGLYDPRYTEEIYRRFLLAKYPGVFRRFWGSLRCNGFRRTFAYYFSRLKRGGGGQNSRGLVE